jgi:hypothetical protein
MYMFFSKVIRDFFIKKKNTKSTTMDNITRCDKKNYLFTTLLYL